MRLARQIAHPNVCRVYDIGEASGHVFLSMEYLAGEDLKTRLAWDGRLPMEHAVVVARQLCAGLAAAHAKGILHHDLKPSNIMIDGDDAVRIMDFGLASLAEPESNGPAVRAGTPAYMSPEQLGGSEGTIRSDIYALGLVLYELFTGAIPFPGTTVRRNRPTAQPSRMVA